MRTTPHHNGLPKNFVHYLIFCHGLHGGQFRQRQMRHPPRDGAFLVVAPLTNPPLSNEGDYFDSIERKMHPVKGRTETFTFSGRSG